MKILKFGGSSIATPDRINKVIEIVSSSYDEKKGLGVVFSAFQGVTDQLSELGIAAKKKDSDYLQLVKSMEKRHVDAAKALLKAKNQTPVLSTIKEQFNELREVLHGIHLVRELTARTNDLVLSFGERLSNSIVTAAIQQSGINAKYIDTRKIVKTDDQFGNAKVDFEQTNKNIKKQCSDTKVVSVITGFIASTNLDETTTLGRGGSDFTASIFGVALKASEIEIWTDVDGVLTADPRKVAKAFSIPHLSYEEAMELSHFGAKVIYPPTIQPALDKKIAIRIKNTFNPTFKGTLIKDKIAAKQEGAPIKGISSIGDISLLRIQGPGMIGISGISMRIFSALARANVNIILITQASSEHSVCFAVAPNDSETAKRALEAEFKIEMYSQLIEGVIVEKDLSILAIVGENMRKTPGITNRLFRALGINGINVIAIAQGSSELNISVVVSKKNLIKALNAIHESFFLSDTKTLNLFLVGTGLIGATLIKQVKNQAQHLHKKHALDIRVIGIANSKKMLFNEEGVALSNWKQKLDASKTKSDLGKFVKRIKEMNLPNSVFVDNTASAKAAAVYEEVLSSSVSIVTPNKIACSGLYSDYEQLKKTASKSNVSFLYETNVGAGLPVISTLKDLIASGDKVIKIQGILSGSLSFIFDAFKEGVLFSKVVEAAVEKGYAEPDPRLDLGGTDVARKTLILARESGLKLEFKDIKVQSLVPENCKQVKNTQELFSKLKEADTQFEEMRKEAQEKGKKLKYIATIEKGKGSASLQAIGKEHPFYELSGNDNIVAYTTERYKERPLVVRGPGAGAEVTAAGVFADIIRIANQ